MAKGFHAATLGRAAGAIGGPTADGPSHVAVRTRPRGPEVAVNLALLAVFLVAARFHLDLYLGSMFEDDAYFYFRIARNIVAGAGVTFDGIAPTNGFHPGWMAVLSGLLAVFHTILSFEAAVVLAGAVPVLVFALTLRPLWFLCVVAALALVGFAMEGVLAAAIAIGLARAIDLRRPLLAGIAAAALVVTRVDLVVVPAIIAAWFIWRREGRLALAIGFGAIAGIAMVVGINLWLAGTPFSVSSMVKASEARSFGLEGVRRLAAWNLSTSGNQVRLLIYAVALGWIVWHRRRAATAGFAAHPVFIGAIFLFLAAHSGLSPLRDWYFAVPVLTALWAAGRIETQAPTVARAGVVVLAAVVPIAAVAWFQLSSLDQVLRYRAELEALDRALPPEAPLYAYDASGFVGYVMWPRVVINGDGLVNTAEYVQSHRDPEWLFDYFEETGTRHVLSDFGDTLCITPWACCTPGSVDEVMELSPTRWFRSKAAWAFREGYSCPLQSK